MKVNIEESWQKILAEEFEKPYFLQLADFVKKEYLKGKVFPPPQEIFRAFSLVPFDKVRVVILGQDPYHNYGQANGLCFAVSEGVRNPPSLQNILKEIENDTGKPSQGKGDLLHLTEQGVLLLNATLSVRAHTPGSHQHKGWEEFTDAVIKKLSHERTHLVFLLWGNYARQKGSAIERGKHLVLESAHPSPFSAHHGFFGNKHFSKTNEYLHAHGEVPIAW